MTLEDLIAIEEIKQMKARYFRYVDTKQYDKFRSLLCNECFYAKVGGDGLPVHEFKSADEHVAVTRQTTKDAHVIIHLAMAPEITITGPNTAKGVWTINALVKLPETSFEGHLHYYEEYRKEDGQWKISKVEYKKRAHFTFDKKIVPLE